MKRVIILLLIIMPAIGFSQSVGLFRYDTVKIYKQGGYSELVLLNKTKDSLGVLTNVGNGRTEFRKSKMLNDSTLIVGIDTLYIRGGSGSGGSPTDTASLSNRINLKLDKNDSTALTGFTPVARFKKGRDSLGGIIDTKLNIADSTNKYTTHKALNDSLFKAMSGILITTRLEFINDTATTTYYSPDLVGKQLTALFIENYPVGFLERPSIYCSFNSTTGTITLTNGTFASEDYVYILYRGSPVFLLDGDGNPIKDDQGNYIIIN